MAYVPIPKDLSNVKTKLMFNLTKRQLICFSIAALVGVPIFFLCKDTTGTSTAVLLMMFAMFPMFMFAMYEKHNQPLEVILKNYINVKFLNPKKRPYMTDNFYDRLERENKLKKEVNEIVGKTYKKRKKANSISDK
ncbi:MAG: PrgI family protein [Clostridia bacterium]